jgi:hypothetical protein
MPGRSGSTSRARQHVDVAVQRRQRQQRVAHQRRVIFRQRLQVRHILGAQRSMDFPDRAGRRALLQQRAQHADMGQVQPHFGETGQRQRRQRQFLDFRVGFEAGVAVDLGSRSAAARGWRAGPTDGYAARCRRSTGA